MRTVIFSDLYCEKAFKAIHEDLWRAEHPHSEYMLGGGRGSTKSCFVSLEIVTGMMHDPKACAIIYRRVGNTLADSVYEQMVWAIDTLGLSSHFVYRKSPLEIVRPGTGQRILFRGADDPKKSKSIRLKSGQYFRFLWFEELAEFRSMEDIRTIKQSVFRSVDRATTFYSYNPPKTAGSWVNEEALKDVPGRMFNLSNYTMVDPAWLGPVFIAEAEALRISNPRAYENEYLGKVTGTGGSVFTNLELREIPDEEIDTMGAFYQGIDWGWFPDPFQWVRCSFDPARRVLYVIDEYRTLRTGNAAAYEALREKITPDESLIADSAERKSIADWHEFGAWHIRGAVKGPGSVEYSMKWLAALSAIVIDPKRCPESAKEFRAYEFERNAAGEFYSGYPDKNNHAIDAVRYALSGIWRRRGE